MYSYLLNCCSLVSSCNVYRINDVIIHITYILQSSLHITCSLRTHNVTNEEHSRMRRSLAKSLTRIWTGFKFRLETPSIHWVKHVGGSKLGASMGVIVKNLLEIQISKHAVFLAESIIIDVCHDAMMRRISCTYLNRLCI